MTANTFVHADSPLAEHMCQVRLLELSVGRAFELRFAHRSHRPDECSVHLAVAAFLLEQD
ncbi:hypothetical protein [Nocardia blacklockiae]|uniref:hypothetical protein n=1 Tax=Nocardia blacklockiae TaxID=480036 RepID=UPI001894C24E|nr:hypothetical protein [Nocardia blacklockiae]MBF6172100.1 hypothetical protein [Nocardia blacklockiae]